MKPTPDQELLLQKHLRKNLKYRETYAEFYDHILTAVEAEKADVLFDDVVIGVIKADFGGTKGMRLIEGEYQRSVFKELKKKYRHYVLDNFRLPGIFITVTLGVIIYFITKQPWFDMDVFLFNVIAIRLIPDILRMITYIRLPRIYKTPLRSIKTAFFKWQNFLTYFIFYLAYLLASHSLFSNPAGLKQITVTPLIITIPMLLVALHSLTYYKIYRDDIKTGLKLT
jgi:hypothetical protein